MLSYILFEKYIKILAFEMASTVLIVSAHFRSLWYKMYECEPWSK